VITLHSRYYSGNRGTDDYLGRFRTVHFSATVFRTYELATWSALPIEKPRLGDTFIGQDYALTFKERRL